ncbi:hypothetical protein KFL_000100480 [Klebsormidium nitens]|uniref:Uncharacterized protein n=1 Tax=Klebsormidium nitens TaxID=105231 RepID=A0A1Y1HK45_KLENI|nr:hypothetical protein KFL_000100480 [Klebsormidium nitens]|eukprot:GAQ78283.1 hypothetical protein KFL_000100480 [Klebsormidium nitens]
MRCKGRGGRRGRRWSRGKGLQKVVPEDWPRQQLGGRVKVRGEVGGYWGDCGLGAGGWKGEPPGVATFVKSESKVGAGADGTEGADEGFEIYRSAVSLDAEVIDGAKERKMNVGEIDFFVMMVSNEAGLVCRDFVF